MQRRTDPVILAKKKDLWLEQCQTTPSQPMNRERPPEQYPFTAMFAPNRYGIIHGRPTAWHSFRKATKHDQTHPHYGLPRRKHRPMQAASTTKEDVPDDGNPQACSAEPPNTPPIRNRVTLYVQPSEETAKEDTSNDKDFLRMPALLGNNPTNACITPASLRDQRSHKRNPYKKELVHCTNKTNRTTKATRLEGGLTDLSNLRGTPEDKDLLMNKETLKLSPRLGINAEDRHSVLKNTKYVEATPLCDKPLSLSQSRMTISITKSLSQMQRLSDQSGNKWQDLKDTLHSRQGNAQLTTSAHYPKSSQHNDRSANDQSLEAQGTDLIELRCANTLGLPIDHRTNVIEQRYDITPESLLMPPSEDPLLIKRTLNAETRITNPSGLSNEGTPKIGTVSPIRSAERALPDISPSNERSNQSVMLPRNAQSFAADTTPRNHWSILTMATRMALLIQETEKHRSDLRTQTTRMMNKLMQPNPHTARRPMCGQYNFVQYKDPSSYLSNRPSYLPDDPLSTPTILRTSLIPLTPNNSPTTSPCPSPPPRTARTPVLTIAPTHSPTTNSWTSQRAPNYPPLTNLPQLMTTHSSPSQTLRSGAKNKKTKKKSRTHGRTLTSSTHLGMLTIAATIPGTVAPPCQAVKRLAQQKNTTYQMAMMQTTKEAAMTAPVLPSGIFPTAASMLNSTTSSLTLLRSSYLTTPVFDLLANVCLLMILPDFASTCAWTVLLSDSPEKSR